MLPVLPRQWFRYAQSVNGFLKEFHFAAAPDAGLEIFFEFGGVSYIKHFQSSINSAKSSSVLPVNLCPLPLSSSAIASRVPRLALLRGQSRPADMQSRKTACFPVSGR
jgi:hypothetical protein